MEKQKIPPCHKCKSTEVEISQSGPHIKASCAKCGAYIKFVSERELTGGNQMSEFEITFKLQNSEYNEVLLLEKYGDNYGIVLAQESKNGNGTVYKRWIYPQKGKDKVPAEKAIPWRIPLGNRQQSLALLQGMVN